MEQNGNGRDRPVSDELHPLVYMAIIGLVLWFVVSVWGFGGDGYTDYLLAVVTGFMVIAVAIPLVLWRIVGNSNGRHRSKKEASHWASGRLVSSIPGRIGSKARTRPSRFFCRLRQLRSG
jgi:hypothetical protein